MPLTPHPLIGAAPADYRQAIGLPASVKQHVYNTRICRNGTFAGPPAGSDEGRRPGPRRDNVQRGPPQWRTPRESNPPLWRTPARYNEPGKPPEEPAHCHMEDTPLPSNHSPASAAAPPPVHEATVHTTALPCSIAGAAPALPYGTSSTVAPPALRLSEVTGFAYASQRRQDASQRRAISRTPLDFLPRVVTLSAPGALRELSFARTSAPQPASDVELHVTAALHL